MKSLFFSSILLLVFITGLLVDGFHPPNEPRLQLMPLDSEQSSDYATLHSPSSGKRLYRGQTFQIIFSDPATTASEARFSLANYTGIFRLQNFNLKSGVIKKTITLPDWVAEGTYDFVVSENDSPFGSDEFNMDVVICTVFVGRPRANQQFFFTTPSRKQEEYNLPLAPFQKKNHFQRRAPHLPVFVSPRSNLSVVAGSQLHIRFLDGELDPYVTSARFVLRPSLNNTNTHQSTLAGTEASADQTHKFNDFAIDTNVAIPKSITPGEYTLVAQEVYPENSQQFKDVASVAIHITADSTLGNGKEKINLKSAQLGQNISGTPSQSSNQSLNILQKRAAPAFRTPTKNQKIITGHHLNISLVNVPESGKVRFMLKPIQTKPKEKQLVLFGKYAEANEIFHYLNSTVNARVFFPLGIANGTYNLVAQDYSKENATELASVQIQVQQLRRLTRLMKKDSLPTSLFDKPTHRREHPVSSFTSSPLTQPCHSNSFETNNLGQKTRSESPTMIKPSAGQEVPIGSKFLCEVHDRFATSETVRFHLRSFSGEDHYLGSSKFVKGIAKFQATCPTNVQFDSYTVLARLNSIKKPQTFFNVVSTSIVISHQPSVMFQPPLLPVRRSTTSPETRLTKPTSNQYIPAGKIFECQLQNVMTSDNIRFMLRTNDGNSDLSVGSVVAKGNIARAKCQIPSSVIPGNYDLVAQKSSKSSPNNFSDMDHVTITLANPRGFGPDISVEEAKKITPRSLQSQTTQTMTSASDKAQVSILVEPMSYQTIVQGQSFQVKLKNNTSPLSTKLRFLLQPEFNSSDNQRYILGTSTNGEAVQATLRCPDHIQSGIYQFVIQSNDPKDLENFVDSSSTTVVIKDQMTFHYSDPSTK